MTGLLDAVRIAGAAVAPHRLFQLNYFVTARCNARCRMCFYLDAIEKANENLDRELRIDEIRRIAAGLGHVPYLALSGGEPFLRRDLFDLLDALAEGVRPVMVSLPTNGAYPDRVEAVIGAVAGRHPATQFDVQLSLDGPEAVHDSVRRVPGLFRRLQDTYGRVRALQERARNVGLKIVITYSTFNQDHVGELLDHLADHMPADRVILAKVHGNCVEDARNGLDLGCFRQLLRRADALNRSGQARRSMVTSLGLRVKRGKERLRGRFDREQDLGRFCGSGRKLAVLTETGDVYPCEVLDRRLGNVRDFDYDLPRLLEVGMAPLDREGVIKSCHCDWGCAQNIAMISSVRFWPSLIR